MFEILEADIVVMQETKIQRKDLQDDMVLVPGWDVFFSLPKHKKGTALTLIYSPQRLTIFRILWRRYLHAQFEMCAHTSRRGRHRHLDSSKVYNQVPRTP
jgi:exonuclease III